MVIYKLDFDLTKSFELVDCVVAVDLFLGNLNIDTILRFTEQIFKQEDFGTC
jgi:hypothetical protein